MDKPFKKKFCGHSVFTGGSIIVTKKQTPYEQLSIVDDALVRSFMWDLAVSQRLFLSDGCQGTLEGKK